MADNMRQTEQKQQGRTGFDRERDTRNERKGDSGRPQGKEGQGRYDYPQKEVGNETGGQERERSGDDRGRDIGRKDMNQDRNKDVGREPERKVADTGREEE